VASNYRRMMARNKRRGQQEKKESAVAVQDAPQTDGARPDGNGSRFGGEDADYASEKYKNAVWLIRNIEKRKSTILRVTEAIMEYQKEFLEKGIEHLRPLTLRDIAERVGMHESTIARVTTKKYVETPRGIFELKFFFSSGLETDEGEAASSRSIKELLTQMIEAEDKRRPLSDQKIADMLRDRGFQIARRTVAKYREQLKILPAKLRKEVS
jgi:RNA polymerase sigma-54 factor